MPNAGGVREKDWISRAVADHERPLTLYALKMLGDLDRARDVVQDTFLKLCSENPDNVADHLVRWLFTVCRNGALDVLRKEKRMAALDPSAASDQASLAPNPGLAIEQQESATQVLEAVERLPAKEREVVRLKFQHNFSYREISEITGLSVSHVGVLLHHAIKHLRSQFADPSPVPGPNAAAAFRENPT